MRHKFVLIFMLLWPLFAALLSFMFSLNAFVSVILFYGMPAFILSLLKPQFVKKTFIASFILFPLAIIGDYVAERTQTWLWPLPHSIFAFRFFSYVSVESVLWVFFQTYATIIFFQFFSGKIFIKKALNKKSKFIMLSTILLSVVFLFMVFLFPIFLNIPYWYLIIGVFFLTPIILFEKAKYPKVFHRLLKTAIYFLYLNFTYEITALSIGWWSFPSKQFIGYFSFLGKTFPLEELVFWVILSSLTVLSYYEYFFNGER